MRKWLILLSALSTMTAHAVPAWTWVDSAGQVHFSDRPVPGATRVELGPAQGFGATARPTSAPSAVIQPSAPTAAEAGYRAVRILSPTEQQTFWNTGGSVNVQVTVEPTLRAGHRIDLVLDGRRRNLDTAGTQLVVSEVFRGVHTLEAIVLDTSGTEVARSGTTTFMVQQTSIVNPN